MKPKKQKPVWKEPRFNLSKLLYPSGLKPLTDRQAKNLRAKLPDLLNPARLTARGPWKGATVSFEKPRGLPIQIVYKHRSGAVMRLWLYRLIPEAEGMGLDEIRREWSIYQKLKSVGITFGKK